MTRRHLAVVLALLAAALVFIAACDPIQPTVPGTTLPPGATPVADPG